MSLLSEIFTPNKIGDEANSLFTKPEVPEVKEADEIDEVKPAKKAEEPKKKVAPAVKATADDIGKTITFLKADNSKIRNRVSELEKTVENLILRVEKLEGELSHSEDSILRLENVVKSHNSEIARMISESDDSTLVTGNKTRPLEKGKCKIITENGDILPGDYELYNVKGKPIATLVPAED